MKKTAILSALSIGVLSISMAFANPEAVNQVRDSSVQVLNILNQANGKNDAQIRRQAENVVTPHFDFELMTALAVGKPWKTANAQQRSALVEGFKNMIRAQYTGTMLKFKNAKVNIKDKPIVKGNDVEVNAQLATQGGKPINVTFVTRKHGSLYRAYDVKLEGGSLVTAYRQQFGEVVRTKGIDGLVAHLQAQNGRRK